MASVQLSSLDRRPCTYSSKMQCLYLSKRSLSTSHSSGLSVCCSTMISRIFCMIANRWCNWSGPAGTLTDDDAFLTVKLSFESCFLRRGVTKTTSGRTRLLLLGSAWLCHVHKTTLNSDLAVGLTQKLELGGSARMRPRRVSALKNRCAKTAATEGLRPACANRLLAQAGIERGWKDMRPRNNLEADCKWS